MKKLLILGGGPAGLSAGYFATKAGLECEIFESNDRVGGNAVTFEENGFRFDSGAHRFHMKDPEMTEEIRKLLGDRLLDCTVPSQIFFDGRFVDFPLSPLNLFKALGPIRFGTCGWQLLRDRRKQLPAEPSFEDTAINAYGRGIASLFLLNYTSKLWGRPCSSLSPNISGKRLKGLDLKSFITESLLGAKAKTAHLDGRFLYPKSGYSEIVDALAAGCGRDRIHLSARIEGLFLCGERIAEIRFADGRTREVKEDEVVFSTLPLSVLVRIMEPGLGLELDSLLRSISFRNVVLVSNFVKRPSLSTNGSIYFPDGSTPVTRVYEPRNRSPFMSPDGKTSVVAEIPCWPGDAIWSETDEEWLSRIRGWMERELGWWAPEEWLGGCVKRMPHAYPVITKEAEAATLQIHRHLAPLKNLRLIGRNGKFTYTHIHDLMAEGKQAVGAISQSPTVDELVERNASVALAG